MHLKTSMSNNLSSSITGCSCSICVQNVPFWMKSFKIFLEMGIIQLDVVSVKSKLSPAWPFALWRCSYSPVYHTVKKVNWQKINERFIHPQHIICDEATEYEEAQQPSEVERLWIFFPHGYYLTANPLEKFSKQFSAKQFE